jgi:zinc protease
MTTFRRAIPSLLLTAGSLAAAPCHATPQDFRLANGLQVTLRPGGGASDVAVVVLFDVGELHDPPGKSGLGHLVEHIYVTAATPTTRQRTVNQFVQDHPKGWNAQTGDDFTVVATVVSPDRLEEELDEAAERMSRLRIEPSDVDREVPRVLSEVSNMFERVALLAARNHARERLHPRPHGGRHGGVPEHVRQLTADDVRQHWNDFCKAGNARLVVAGNVDPDAIERKVRQTFGGVPAGRPVPAAPAALPPRFWATRLGYACPPPDSKLFPAFLVLVARLQAGAMQLGGDVREFPVVFAPLDDPGTLYLTSRAKEGETSDEALGRLSKLVAQAARPGNLRQAAFVGKQLFAFPFGTTKLPDSMLRNNVYGVGFGVARRKQLGTGGEQLADAMDALQPETVQQCAREYLAEDRRAVVIVEGKPAAGSSKDRPENNFSESSSGGSLRSTPATLHGNLELLMLNAFDTGLPLPVRL